MQIKRDLAGKYSLRSKNLVNNIYEKNTFSKRSRSLGDTTVGITNEDLETDKDCPIC